MADFTESQKKALQSKNKTVLVSAGAGSGKTTVLTSRIAEKIKDGASISDFLVVTFTRASAADLREKLFKMISKLSEEASNENHDWKLHYQKQLFLLADANIGTISSYCLKVIRSHAQELGISPMVRVMSEDEANMMISEAMQQVISEVYESQEPHWALLADTLSGTKDDGPFEKSLTSIYRELRSYQDYFHWMEVHEMELLQSASGTLVDFFQTSLGQRMQERISKKIDTCLIVSNECILFNASPKMNEYFTSWKEYFQLLKDALRRGYECFYDTLKGTSLDCGDIPTKEILYLTARRDWMKGQIKWFTKELLCDVKILREQLNSNGLLVRALREILIRFENIYDEMKRNRAVVDFSDCEHGLFSLLLKDGKETDLCHHLRGQIKEIYIDEYQDVSPLQDEIFRLLSNGRNRFMVGDLKQSIYAFRNAHPDIFLNYKESFPDYPGDDSPNERIFLKENFRCGEKIIQFTNWFFNTVTKNTPYEREYRGEDLVYQKNSGEPYPVTIASSQKKGRSSGPAVENEAEYIACEIEKLMDGFQRNPTEDECKALEAGKEVDLHCQYRDIVILFNYLKNHTSRYEEALKRHGIPYRVTQNEKLFDQPEVQLAMSILKCIDDPTDDFSLFASLRSPVFRFTSQEIYEVRSADMTGSLYHSVRAFSEGSDALSKKCEMFLEQLNLFRSYAEGRSCHEFLWELYANTGMLYLSGEKGRTNLLVFYEYARNYERSGYKGLSGFLSYLRSLEEKGIEVPGAVASDGENCVTLTTIHKSKGLEYPIVFVANCGATNSEKASDPYLMSYKEGIFFKLNDYEKLTCTETAVFTAAKEIKEEANLGETLRKLYVAFTRAKEKLYITGFLSESMMNGGAFFLESGSSMEILKSAMELDSSSTYEFVRIPNFETETGNVSTEIKEKKPEPFSLTEDMKEVLSFQYPFGNSHATKISVSELKEAEWSGEQPVSEILGSKVLSEPKFLSTETVDHDRAHAGTANHMFLQYCDFENVKTSGVKAEAQRLCDAHMLQEKQVELLNPHGIEKFMSSDLQSRMAKSKKLYREQFFEVQLDARILGIPSDDKVLLSGIIDAFFEEEDGSITVVDYKTDHVDSAANLRERYRIQLDCYKKAVEEMTGQPVKKQIIWSLWLNEAIEV